jgi:DNA polymerase elongation subunit (family B)
MTLEYSIESEGNFVDEPIVELFCRDENGNSRMIEVEGFYPSFYITEEEFIEHQNDVLNDSMVREVLVREELLDERLRMNTAVTSQSVEPRRRLDEERLVQIYTVKPSQVPKLRGFFDWHGEADVFFTNRFLIDSGIHSPRRRDPRLVRGYRAVARWRGARCGPTHAHCRYRGLVWGRVP